MIKIIILLITFIVCIFLYKYNNTKETMINLPKISASWDRNKCNFHMQETLENVLKENNIQQDKNAEFFIPCLYDDIDKEIDQMPLNKKRYFIIDNADEMVAKQNLWKNVLAYHGLEKTKTLLPMTHVLDAKGKKAFEKDFDENKVYILKNNNQRQEGLKISNSLTEILNNKDYVLVQELLQNPLLIDKRKTNMRFYVLVVCNKKNLDVYVYEDGFMYYTKENFKKNSLEFGPNITTGYIDRQVYIDNPLTHTDFKNYLDLILHDNTSINIRRQNKSVSDVCFQRIHQLLKDVFSSFIGKICNGKLQDKNSFQLFGVDVAVDSDLNSTIMEINKGPDMGVKDDRDGVIKKKCLTDLLKLIGVLKNTGDNGFINILET